MARRDLHAVPPTRFEAPSLERLGGRVDGGVALDIGCGDGAGIETIFRRFGAGRVHGFDADPRTVAVAAERLAGYLPGRLALYVARPMSIPEPDGRFDAVFDFGSLQGTAAWPHALAEVRRVLKPGGRFYFEEVTAQARAAWHGQARRPQRDLGGFGMPAFLEELERHGLVIESGVESVHAGELFIGVAWRR